MIVNQALECIRLCQVGGGTRNPTRTSPPPE
jgi:hypothetical protein